MDTGQLHTGPASILIVEDDPKLCNYLGRVLEKAGYPCRLAESCEEGRAAFSEGAYSCCLIDLGLPDGDGRSLMSDLLEIDPSVVAIVLTGDAHAETVIDTMRGGAFDYLTKPVNRTVVETAVQRAVSHHAVLRERAELVRLLLEEREHLRARIEAATADLRRSNDRLHALLNLTRLSSHHLSSEDMIRQLFTELAPYMPLRCMALCDVTRQKFVALVTHEGLDEPEVIFSEGDSTHIGYDSLLIEAEPRLLMRQWVERMTGVYTSEFADFVYPQTLWNRSVSSVGFYLDPSHTADENEQEFLGMCARLMAFEWEQAHLLLQVAHQASLGSIAAELTRNFVQPLTAIRTTAEVIREEAESEDVLEGIALVQENVERLHRQTQEFRQLALLREDTVETVVLGGYVQRALDILAVTIQSRNVHVEQDIDANCECVLLNGTALSRVFLDVILGALRAVEVGGVISLRLHPEGQDLARFEVSVRNPVLLPGSEPNIWADDANASLDRHPMLLLAQRTVHTCGGKLTLEITPEAGKVLRIEVTRNATSARALRQVAL